MYKKILVPLDGSEISEQALEHVKELMPVPSTTEIVLLRVVDPLATTYAGGTDAAIEVAVQIQKKAEAEAASYLKKVAGELEEMGIEVKTVLTVGLPADVILDYARQNGVDLIIMSTHGRSGISRWLFGSVAEKIIRHSQLPVLISPPHGSRGVTKS